MKPQPLCPVKPDRAPGGRGLLIGTSGVLAVAGPRHDSDAGGYQDKRHYYSRNSPPAARVTDTQLIPPTRVAGPLIERSER
jgi:hypothetical protein